MDSIESLLKSQGYNSILVVVDWAPLTPGQSTLQLRQPGHWLS